MPPAAKRRDQPRQFVEWVQLEVARHLVCTFLCVARYLRMSASEMNFHRSCSHPASMSADSSVPSRMSDFRSDQIAWVIGCLLCTCRQHSKDKQERRPAAQLRQAMWVRTRQLSRQQLCQRDWGSTSPAACLLFLHGTSRS